MTKFNRGVDWAAAETELMVAMLTEGKTHAVIADALNDRFHEGATVRRPVQIAGKVQHLRQRGKLPEFDGENRHHAGKQWSADEIRAMSAARCGGMTLEGIARQLNARFHGGADIRNAAQVAYQARCQGVTITSAQSRYIRVRAQKKEKSPTAGFRRSWTAAELAVVRDHAGPRVSATKLAGEINRRCHGGVEIRNRDNVRALVSNLRRAGTLEQERPVNHAIQGSSPGDNTALPCRTAAGIAGDGIEASGRRDRPGNGVPQVVTTGKTAHHPSSAANPVRPGDAVVPSETAAADPDGSAAFFGPQPPIIQSGALIGPSRSCCWIEGTKPYFADGADPYCGRASTPDSSYCPDHRARVFRKAPVAAIMESSDVA